MKKCLSEHLNELTTSVPYKTRQMLSFLEEIPSTEKKIEIITNVLNQLKEESND